MNPRDLNRTSTGALARLMDLETVRGPQWQPDELGAILRHQLAAPLDFDLADAAPDARQTLATAASTVTQPPRTFGELFRHPQPPPALLELAKQFGKAHRENPDSPLPPEIATVVYYASIVVARLRGQRRISDLSDEAIRRGIEWTLAQPWLEESLRALFEEAWQQIESHG